MSVSVQKKDLLEAMQKALPVVPSKSSLQVLSNFKLSYANSVLEIAATDADHSLRVTVGASGEPLDITVNAKKISEIVRELPEGEVSLEVDGTVLLMESEKGFSCKIAGADSEEFPGVPEIENGVELSISESSLRDMIQKSSFAVSKDESRASLCGVLWELSADKTGMVATDGHRLGYSFINANLPVKESFNRIMSQKSVATLVKITDSKNQDESVKVVVGDKYISFETPSFVMVSKIIEGQYPDYNKVIPKNNPKVITADKVGLLEAVRRVSVLSSQKNHLVKLIFTSGTVEVVVKNTEIGGEAKEVLHVDYDGEEHTVGFNGQYFSEIIDIVKTQKVRLEMNTQISACLIYPEYADEKEKTSEDLFLIMPLRIMDEV
jgi:DNA polymerase-3 subunit beta